MQQCGIWLQTLCSTSSNFSPLLTLQDRIASLNGRTVQLVIRQDRPGFIRLIGISVLQSAASAVLAPSLRQVADALAMTWRRRLTTAAHARYFKGNTFYTTSQLAGQPALLLWSPVKLCPAMLCQAVLRYAMLCCVVLSCPVLCCAMLCPTLLRGGLLCCDVLCEAMLYLVAFVQCRQGFVCSA